MKKLMTMIAAAAMAFGLYADDEGFLSGTSFNSWQAGKPVEPPTTEGLEWSNISADSEIGEAKWVASDFGQYGVPAKYEGINPVNALNIKSALNAFATVSNATDAAGAKIYVDTLVKFTAFDVDDTAELGTSDAKLGVWLKENEDGTQTNLFITAGVIEGTDVTSTQAYDCGPYTAGEWCRLTIKSLGEISSGYGVYGFVVFVNGSAVTALEKNPISYGTLPLTTLAQYYANEKCLFPSIVTQEDFSGVLGFAGQGAIDDLVFTTKAPVFAEDVASYTLKWDETHMDHVKTNGADVVGHSPLVVYADAPVSITFSWTGKDGKASGSKTITPAEGTFEITESDLDDAEAEFNGDPLTLEKAIEAANEAEADGTLKLLTEVDEKITIENTAEKTITLDLAGQNVNVDGIVIETHSDVVITNSVDAGKVTGKVINKEEDTDLTIMAGTFDGVVDAAGSDGYVIIWGGRFLATENEELAENAEIRPVGMTLVADGDTGYLIVGEPPVTKFAVTWDDSKANATAVAKVDNVEIDSGDEVETDKEVAFTVTPEEGYEYATEPEDGWTLETDGTITQTFMVEDEALEVTIPTATIKTFTVTYIVDGKQDSIEKVNWGANPANVPTPPAKTGYTGEWDKDPTTAVIKADETFTYTYTAETYTITYTTGNGAVVTNGVTEYTIESDTFNLPVAADIDMSTVEGVTFAGWTNATSEAVVTKVDKGTTGDLEFFAKWEAVAPAEKDPADDDPEVIDENETAAQRYGNRVPEELANVSAKVLCSWATGNGGLKTGDPIIENAFLLNCANDQDVVDDLEAAFKIPSITVAADGTVTVAEPEGEFNGKIEQWGKVELDQKEWVKDQEGAKFFMLKLVPENLN